jgi:hypothetical protein
MSYDAHEIFRHAVAFEDAADALQDRLAGGPVSDATPASQTVNASRNDFCPQIVLEAFAIELYLKCIATIETGDTPGGHHDLWRYFKRLPADSKRRITQHYKEVLEGTVAPLLDIEQALKQSAEAFELFRYLYEHLDKTLVYSASMVTTAARRRILEMQPTWKGDGP